MKRMTKKLGAIVLALALCLSLCATAFAATGDYSITISNATVGETYTAYKIFDATVGKDSEGNAIVAYSINSSSNSAIFSMIVGNVTADNNGVYTTDLFTLTPTNTANVYTVTINESATSADIIAFFNENITYDPETETVTPSGLTSAVSAQATANTVKLEPADAGYYFVTSSLGAVVTITTTDPDAVVIDKNNPPKITSKEIVVVDKEDITTETEAIGDDVEFKITAEVPRYAPGDSESPEGYLVTDYEFDDSMTSGLDIENLSEVDSATSGLGYYIDGEKYYASNDLIDSWIYLEENGTTYYLVDGNVVIDETTGETTSVTGCAYNVSLELIYSYTDTEGTVHFEGFILTYDTVDKDADYSDVTTASEIETKYPVNATIYIDYEAHVTDAAVYENENDIDMIWNMTTFRGPTPNEPRYKGSDKKDAEVYTWELDVLKVDAETNETLAGATFELSGTGLHDVVISNTYTYSPLEGMEKYTEAKNDNAVLWFELNERDEDNNPVYTTVNPYELTDQGELSKYVTNDNVYITDPEDPDYGYIYTAYIRTTETTVSTDSKSDQTVTGTTDAAGNISFKGLSAGEYSLKEIVAPNGYNLLPDNIYFTISYDEETNQFTFTWTDENYDPLDSSTPAPGSVDMHDGEISITVKDNAGTELPGTGGIGTTIFYIIGGVLVAGAVVVLVTRRRMTRES